MVLVAVVPIGLVTFKLISRHNAIKKTENENFLSDPGEIFLWDGKWRSMITIIEELY